MAKKRVTFTLDEDLDKKIRQLQINLISSTNQGWSYSSVLGIVIDEGLKAVTPKKLSKLKS
ncbi:MAG TPA: hypothetical protein VNK44_08470 [Candidatus Nitrosotenuis sp.]|nr:hypothetical protein [Candidatus Nitrosotenuis sp.]